MSSSHAGIGKWGEVLTIVPIVAAGFATIVYLLRLYSRRLGGTGLATEDFLMGIGLLLSYGATVFVVYTAFNGVGMPSSSLPKWKETNLRFGSWMIQKFWAPSMAFIKISIVVFLQRIMGPIGIFRNICTALIVFIVAWAVTALMGNIFQCWPVTYYYKPYGKGHCMSHQTSFFETMGALSLIVDVCILCLPMPWVLRLHVDLKKKIAVVCIFSMGALVCIFSLLRLVQFRYFLTTNLASSSALESIWTILEMDMAVICGCMPLLTPLFRKCVDRVRTTTSKSTPHSNSHSASRLYARSGSNPSPHWAKFERLGGVDSKTPPHSEASGSRNRQDPLSRQGHNGDELDDDSSIELQGIAVHTVVSLSVESHKSAKDLLEKGSAVEPAK
ncbi:integral membrane protein [Talaromyces stipitatus ATCC 10500]|uniref:Integral membrane protein n=1 Tax=Talaromyces stipitatus (strain ATCC 10500 / CBS 375.48 / QM 6759 / NRRL 1006) TaxID=441959 RepID=B8MML7_TALSN|nr:uncharacterized protein TSTA_100170 [Talaromyces stipitatus ATCC 10500]EED13771.1 integral membrane protein [Talaromyces stipitatus ATCC 10500]